MDRRPPQLPNLPPRSAPALPSLDRSAPPSAPQQQVQLTGPQKLDSPEQKLSVLKSMSTSVTPVRLSTLIPCSLHPCLNLTNLGQLTYDLTFSQYKFSGICPSCAKHPKP